MAPEWIDLTHEIDESTLVYPGDPLLRIHVLADHAKDGFRIASLETGMHVGTHLDSPYHFVESGYTIEGIPLSQVIGEANVVHVAPVDGVIRTESIEEAVSTLDNRFPILLIDTGHGRHFNTEAYFKSCPSFEASFFTFCMNQGIRTVGLDLPTIQYANQSPKQAHLDFLGQEITIIEGLKNLEQLHADVFFSGLPLKIKGMDGSMIRAVAKNLI